MEPRKIKASLKKVTIRKVRAHASLAIDLLGVALTIVGNISERRTARLLHEKLNNGLPAFLTPPEAKKGLNSGLMTGQYTAVALASENKVLAHPAFVDSIPTSANFEDFVSMGVTAAQKAMQILENVEYGVAIELLCAAQAIEFHNSEKLGKGTKTAYSTIIKTVPTLEKDRVSSENREEVRQTVKNGLIIS
jgi:histidine ammonia-lyase